MDRRTFGRRIAAATALAGLPLVGFAKDSSEENFPKKILKPKRLKPGDTIGLVTPASPITEEQLEKTIENIERLGFKLQYNRKRLLARKGYLAGKDIVRADEINRMFNNKEIDGIWCVRGGYGVTRMLDMLNYKVIRDNPKVLIGYSDITALHQAIFKKTGLVGFHGPVGASEFTDYTKEHLLEVVSKRTTTFEITASPANEAMENQAYNSYVIRDGIAEGRLVGGNLTLAASLVGTPYDISYNNKLVFLEDIGEKPYRLDRMLTQMILAGKFNKVKGIVLGVFLNCEAGESDNSLTLEQMFKDKFRNFNIPIIYGMSFGHISNQFTLPLGIKAKLNTADKTVTLLEPAVV